MSEELVEHVRHALSYDDSATNLGVAESAVAAVLAWPEAVLRALGGHRADPPDEEGYLWVVRTP